MKKKTLEVPRLRTIDRQQMVIRPVDVDKLIEADHPARGIWELVGSLDLSSFYQAIEAVEGEAGSAGPRSPIAGQPVGLCVQHGSGVGARD